MGSRLRAARTARRVSQDRLAFELERRAAACSISTATRSSLKEYISKWENGHQTPDEMHRQLLREIFGLTDEELGFAARTSLAIDVPTGAEELTQRLERASTVDVELVRALQAQTDHIRMLDRRLGGPVLLEQMRSHIASVLDLLQHAVLRSQRKPLAAVLADSAMLAGWQALYAGGLLQAWSHLEMAKAAAQEAASPAILAHAMAEQAFTLADLGRTDEAVDLVREARAAEQAVPPLLTCWLHAAEGEVCAAAGLDADARRALDAATCCLPGDADGSEIPFVALNEAHLTRWRGHTLARLGDSRAIDQLYTALDGMNGVFVRAEAGLRSDLAYALTTAGEPDEARVQARKARALANRIGSLRQRRRLDRLGLTA